MTAGDSARRDGTKDEESAAVSGDRTTPGATGASGLSGEGETRELSAVPGESAGPASPEGPAPADSASPGSASTGAATPGSGSPDSSFGEDELRALFHGAVDGLAPGPGVLDRLQAAVPARRARKRQTLVGAAAAVILLGTAIPAAVHVAAAPGHEADPAMAGSSQDAHASTSPEARRHEDARRPDHRSGGTAPHPSASGEHRGGASTPPGPDPHPSADTVLADAPRCAAAQLGDAAADRSAPAADGTVYGSFRVANVSGEKCAVTSPGKVRVAVVGGMSRTAVPVVEHQDGDAAAGLPGTSQPALLLGPGQSYEVRFAFVPDSPCPSGGPTKGADDPGPSAPPSGDPSSQPPAEGGGSGAGPGASPDAAVLDQTTTQFTRSVPVDDAPVTTTVEVTHNAAPGGPVTNTTIPESCPGTVYRTGLLPADGG